MAKTFRVRGTALDFPRVCAVCGKPAVRTFTVEKTFFYGRSSTPLSLQAPACADHAALARGKSQAENFVVRAAPWVGGGVGVAVCVWLLIYWAQTGQGNLALNLIMGIITGLAFFVTAWATLVFWIAPRFAPGEAKRIRNTVRMEKYWPSADMLEITFENDTVADLVMQMNRDRLIG